MKRLKPTLSLFQVTFLGIGTMVGAGIYVLVGKIAGTSGELSIWAFVAASLIVSFSAYSHGFLAKHIPSSAGAAEYVHQAFNQPWLALAVGLGVLLTGIVSAATLANGFYGYFSELVVLPGWLVITTLIASLCYIASRPINTSANVAVAITLVELAGLGIVIAFSEGGQSSFQLALPRWSAENFQFVMAGAFIAFYAYVGFEDIVNLAEEVEHPDKTMLPAIMIALAVTTFLYIMTAWVALASLPIDQLAKTDAPFSAMLAHAPILAKAISVIGLIAIVNGALVQILMGSRMLFGLSRRGQLPAFFSAVSKAKIPINSTIFVSLVVWLFAIALPLLTLAKLTSGIMLCVFIFVNVSAATIALKRHEMRPCAIAITGTIASLLLIGSAIAG